MKRKLISLFGAIAVAMFMTFSTTWSSSASAQSVACSGTTCTYGPICVDAWGGCYFYSWRIGSAMLRSFLMCERRKNGTSAICPVPVESIQALRRRLRRRILPGMLQL